MCDAPIASVSGFSPKIHETYNDTAESGMLRRHTQKEDERMVDQEMLAAISELLDQKLDQKLEEKLQPIYGRLDKLETDMNYVRVVQLENNVIPRLNTIEACYLDAAKKFAKKAEKIDAMSEDIKTLQIVVAEHSQKLNRISV